MKANTFIKATFVACNMLIAMLSKGQVTFHLDSNLTLEPYIPPAAQMPGNTTTLDSNEVKLVYWVHGLSGSLESWSPVQLRTEDQQNNPIFNYPERLTEGLVFDYSSLEGTHSIFAIADKLVKNEIPTWHLPTSTTQRDTFNHNHSFVISHSQGGIVARGMRYQKLKKNYPTHFGGIATFGTSHGGAPIIVNSHPVTGAAVNWLTEGCAAFTEAKLQDFLNQKWFIDALIPSSALQNASMQVCDGLGSMVFPILINSIRKPVGSDYAPGAATLATLDSVAALDTAFPVVVFYGVEQEPVLWRLLHSMTYTTDNSLSGSIVFNDPFGLTYDSELPGQVNYAYWQFKNQEDYYNNRIKMYQNWRMVAGTAGVSLLLVKGAREKATTYKNAHLWLGNANLVWKRLIGARLDTIYNNGYECYCHNEVIPTFVSDPGFCVDANGNSNKCYTIPSFVQQTIEKPNDGVVTAASQTAYPNPIDVIRMEDTNHMQERNCEETKKALNLLFDGKIHPQFHLNEK